MSEMEAVLRAIVAMQPKRVEWFRSQGIVFDKAPGPVADVTPEHPDYWQHVAFSIYTDLCEIDTLARNALDGGWVMPSDTLDPLPADYWESAP